MVHLQRVKGCSCCCAVFLQRQMACLHTCLLVIALRCSSSSVGRYMMTPTQLNRVSGGSSGVLEAGLSADLLLEVQRCSIGLGAGMPCLSIRDSSSSTYWRSAKLGFLRKSTTARQSTSKLQSIQKAYSPHIEKTACGLGLSAVETRGIW